MAVDPYGVSSEAFLHDYAPFGQRHHMPYLDHSWIPQVTAVGHAALLDVELAWEPRGWDGVEYLVTWMEEGRMVSGQLVTKDNKANLSLWPGQKYNIQVEVLDLQGNTVIKSHASPIILHNENTGTTTIANKLKIIPTKYQTISTRSQITFPTTTFVPISTSSERISTTTLSYNKTQPHINSSRPTPTKFLTKKLPKNPISRSTPGISNIKISIINKSEKSKENNSSILGVRERLPIEYSSEDRQPDSLEKSKIDDVTVNVLEVVEVVDNENVNNSSNISVMVVWGTGVVLGALLILCICALVIWMLKKSRKTNTSVYLPDSSMKNNLSVKSKESEYLPDSSVKTNFSLSVKEESDIRSVKSDKIYEMSGKSDKIYEMSGKSDKIYEMSGMTCSSQRLQKPPPLYGVHGPLKQEDYIIVSENPYQRRPLPPLPPVPPEIEMNI